MKKYVTLLLLVVLGFSSSCATRVRVSAVGEGEFTASYMHRDRVVARERAWKYAQNHCHGRAVVVRENLRPNGRIYQSEIVFRCN